jgi:hypothetical protein
MNADAARYNWSNIRSRVYSLADNLGEKSCGGSLPVPVKHVVEWRSRLASRCLPTSVYFRPLFVDGCVLVTKAGFNIYVGCEQKEVRGYDEMFKNETNGAWLPPRMRFTIAHEIGHTLLFDSVAGQPRGWVKVDHYKILEALEGTCDNVAGHILLPNDLIRAELRKNSPYSPNYLRSLAESAKVSAAMLVRRMAEMGELISELGAFGYAVESGNNCTFAEFRSHASVAPAFGNVRVGQSISEFAKRATRNFVLNGGGSYTDTAVFPELPEWLGKFEFACETAESKGARRGFFVTARLLPS